MMHQWRSRSSSDLERRAPLQQPLHRGGGGHDEEGGGDRGQGESAARLSACHCGNSMASWVQRRGPQRSQDTRRISRAQPGA